MQLLFLNSWPILSLLRSTWICPYPWFSILQWAQIPTAPLPQPTPTTPRRLPGTHPISSAVQCSSSCKIRQSFEDGRVAKWATLLMKSERTNILQYSSALTWIQPLCPVCPSNPGSCTREGDHVVPPFTWNPSPPSNPADTEALGLEPLCFSQLFVSHLKRAVVSESAPDVDPTHLHTITRISQGMTL